LVCILLRGKCINEFQADMIVDGLDITQKLTSMLNL